jgi:hypothetical protein
MRLGSSSTETIEIIDPPADAEATSAER